MAGVSGWRAIFQNKPFVLFLAAIPIALTLGGLGYIAHRHVVSRGTVPVDSHPVPHAQVVISGFLYTRSVDGQTKWFIRAQKASIGKGEATTSLWNLSAHILVKPGLVLDISGDRGVIDQISHQFYVKENQVPVAARFSNGLVIVSGRLDYDDKTDAIHTDGQVLILGHAMTIHGRGLHSTPKKQFFQLDEGVRAVFAG
ncbi:MAG: LPS export ABC transporter periplasmic protein LptC [Leptospirillum sp.]